MSSFRRFFYKPTTYRRGGLAPLEGIQSQSFRTSPFGRSKHRRRYSPHLLRMNKHGQAISLSAFFRVRAKRQQLVSFRQKKNFGLASAQFIKGAVAQNLGKVFSGAPISLRDFSNPKVFVICLREFFYLHLFQPSADKFFCHHHFAVFRDHRVSVAKVQAFPGTVKNLAAAYD